MGRGLQADLRLARRELELGHERLRVGVVLGLELGALRVVPGQLRLIRARLRRGATLGV